MHSVLFDGLPKANKGDRGPFEFLIFAYRCAAFSLGLFNSIVASYTVTRGLKSVVLSVLDRQ